MPVITLLLILVVAAVFLVSGTSKLLDQTQTEHMFREFGLPAALARPAALLLPLTELAAGIALLIPGLARWGAWGILLLLLLFTAVLTASLARGIRPACHCFGQLSSNTPIGWRTLLRNAVLIGMALLLIRAGPETGLETALGFLARLSPLHWLAAGGFVAFLLLAGVQFWLIWQLWRQNGRLMLRIEALEAAQGAERMSNRVVAPGELLHTQAETRAPGFELPVVGGAHGSLDGLLAVGRPVLLIFADAGCSPCQALLPEIQGWQQRFGNRLTIAVVGSGWRKKQARQTAGLANLYVQEKREVAERYGVPGSPAAVLIRPDGMLVSRVVTGADGVRQLLQAALSPTPRPQAAGAGGNGRSGTPQPPKAEVAAGQLVPSITLRDLDGKEVNLADWLGQETVLLFWSPSCGFCQRVLPELRGWERERPAGSPKLLIISSGAAEANRAMELASPVLLDDAFRTGRMFGAAGTPSAVLVDGGGESGVGRGRGWAGRAGAGRHYGGAQ